MKKIGIIGGLGPLATVDFFKKIVENTPVEKDQDNIPILIYNNPQIPDRTKAILYGGESPVDKIVETARVLEDMGADFLCMPCNTSFYFYNEVIEKLRVPLLNMVDITVNHIREGGFKRVCLLGTEGTIRSNIYYDKFRKENIDFYGVDDEMIGYLNHIIYDMVKKDKFSGDISGFVSKLREIRDRENVDIFILACSELPIFFERMDLDFEILDPTKLLALEAIKRAMEE